MTRFTVYIIKSDLVHYYIGQTIDLNDRLKRHNQGRSNSTKNKGRWKLVTAVKVNSRSEAVKLESKLKRMKNSKKAIEYLNNLGSEHPDKAGRVIGSPEGTLRRSPSDFRRKPKAQIKLLLLSLSVFASSQSRDNISCLNTLLEKLRVCF